MRSTCISISAPITNLRGNQYIKGILLIKIDLLNIYINNNNNLTKRAKDSQRLQKAYSELKWEKNTTK